MSKGSEMSFWEHLDELRRVLFRIVVVLLALTIVMFFLKKWLFAIVFAPGQSDFILYRILAWAAQQIGFDSVEIEDFTTQLINTQLTGQFMAHLRVAFYGAAVVGIPYVLWQLFGFVAPGLYAQEKRSISRAMGWGQVLFALGVLVNYFLVFPLSFRFLFLYEVDNQINNLIDLSSYLDTLLILTLMMGLMFEVPLVCVLLSKMGVVSGFTMRKYRRHVVVAVITLSAIITPTTDVLTLLLVSLPIYLLYEAGTLVVVKQEKKRRKKLA